MYNIRLRIIRWIWLVYQFQRQIQDRRAGRPPPPRFKKIGIVFKNFDCIQTLTLILINIQCLQYVFYSLLLLQNIGYTCVKGYQNRPKNSIAPGPRRPILKFLDQPLNSIESFPLIRVITTREWKVKWNITWRWLLVYMHCILDCPIVRLFLCSSVCICGLLVAWTEQLSLTN